MKFISKSIYQSCLFPDQLLIPALVNGKSKNAKSRSRFLEFENIWTGAYCTFAQAKDSGEVLVCGLNNYTQLGKFIFWVYVLFNPPSDD